MKVALLANLKQNAPARPDLPPDWGDDLDTWETIQPVIAAMEKEGHQVTFLEGDESLYNNLQAIRPDICFNLCQGHFGETRRAQIPAILEMLQLPYTGSQAFTMALDYGMMKRIFAYHHLPTPPFQIFEGINEPLNPNLRFPLRIQSSQVGSYHQLRTAASIHDVHQLTQQLNQFFKHNQQPALVEQIIDGPEIVVGTIGNVPLPRARELPEGDASATIFQGLHLFPPLEIPQGSHRDVGNTKMDSSDQPGLDLAPVHLTASIESRLKWLAAAAFRVTGCLDLAVIRFRLDVQDKNTPYIITVDSLPSLAPNTSLLWQAATTEGWSYKALINRIFSETAQRYWLETASNQMETKSDRLSTKQLPTLVMQSGDIPERIK